MTVRRFTSCLAVLALAAGPALAQGNTATTPNNPPAPASPAMPNASGGMSSGANTAETGTEMGASHHHVRHMGSTASHRGMREGRGGTSAADNSADQLNARELSSMQGGAMPGGAGGATGQGAYGSGGGASTTPAR